MPLHRHLQLVLRTQTKTISRKQQNCTYEEKATGFFSILKFPTRFLNLLLKFLLADSILILLCTQI